MGYVLISGGTSGLGIELVNVFACNGYNIIIGYNNNRDIAIEISNNIISKYNVKCIVEHLDITSESIVNYVFNKYKIDVVINNAAYSCDNYIEDKSFNEFMNVVKVNLCGTYLMCKYAKNAKTIINISSKDGIDTYNPISLDYCSSKAGIINLSKNLSLYYKNKILCICPGWINTSSVMEMNPKYLNSELLRIGQNKLLDKKYVANKIFDIFLSDIKSGSVVCIDE